MVTCTITPFAIHGAAVYVDFNGKHLTLESANTPQLNQTAHFRYIQSGGTITSSPAQQSNNNNFSNNNNAFGGAAQLAPTPTPAPAARDEAVCTQCSFLELSCPYSIKPSLSQCNNNLLTYSEEKTLLALNQSASVLYVTCKNKSILFRAGGTWKIIIFVQELEIVRRVMCLITANRAPGCPSDQTLH